MKSFTYEELQDIKNLLLVRDGSVCYLCKQTMSIKHIGDHLMTVDHIIPKSRGGSDQLWNLRLTHKICNSIKADSMDVADITKKIDQYLKREP